MCACSLGLFILLFMQEIAQFGLCIIQCKQQKEATLRIFTWKLSFKKFMFLNIHGDKNSIIYYCEEILLFFLLKLDTMLFFNQVILFKNSKLNIIFLELKFTELLRSELDLRGQHCLHASGGNDAHG
jgi:hypothetical protein